MTDDRTDELASAHLDGATSPEEAAQVAADPALQARVEELRAVRAAVGALPPVDTARRDVAIAAAVFAFEDGASRAEDVASAGVTSLAAVAARRGPSPRALRLVGVAAAVILLAALVPLLGQLGRSDDTTETATRGRTFEETGGATSDDAGDKAESAPAAGSLVPDDTTTETAAPPTDLGHFDDLPALVAAIDARAALQIGGAATEVEAGSDGGGNCLSEQSTQFRANGARTIDIATAIVGGDEVVALIVTGASGTRSWQIFLDDTCTRLAERTL